MVNSSAPDDPQQGLATLEQTDVLIWRRQARQMEIEPTVAPVIVTRIKTGKLPLIAGTRRMGPGRL